MDATFASFSSNIQSTDFLPTFLRIVPIWEQMADKRRQASSSVIEIYQPTSNQPTKQPSPVLVLLVILQVYWMWVRDREINQRVTCHLIFRTYARGRSRSEPTSQTPNWRLIPCRCFIPSAKQQPATVLYAVFSSSAAVKRLNGNTVLIL